MPARSVLTHAVQRIAILAVLLTCLLLLWIGAQTPMQVAVLFAIVAGASLRPAEAVLATVAAVPVVRPVLATAGLYAGATAELLVTATVSGCLLRALVGDSDKAPGGVPPWRAAAIVLAAVAAASLLVELAALRVLISPQLFWPSLWSEIASYASRGRMDLAGRFSPVPAALAIFTGALFFAAVSALPGRSIVATRLLKMFVAGATACALLNIARFAGAVLRSDAPLQALPQLLRSVRISVAFDDVNAAGSFFVLAAFTAAGLAVAEVWGQGPETGRTQVRRRLATSAWLAATCLCGVALWLSGSRAAFLAGLAATGLWLTWHGGRVARRVLPAMAVAALLGIWAFPNPIVDRSAVGAMSIRMELARVSFRLLAEAPMFGIGVGRFYYQSGREIQDPAVRAIYPRENAHNNFLQILTELGVVGLASFVAVLASLALRARATPPASAVAGATIGAAAFLVTCFAGHPLLTPEVSLSFWALLAAIAAGTSSDESNWRSVALMAIVLLVASMPFRIAHETRTLNLGRVAYGLADWEHDAQGDAFRRLTPRVTLFVPADATSIELPYRLVSDGGPVTVEVAFAGRSADRLVVADTAWRTFRMTLIKRQDEAPFLPLELRVSSGDASLVGLGRLVVHRNSTLPR